MTTNRKEYQRAYYQANKEKFKAAQKRYLEKKKIEKQKVSNPRLFDMREDYRAQVREKFQAVPQPKMSKAMEYYYANRERILEQQKASRKRAKVNAKQREYYAKNRDHIRELSRKNRVKKRREEKLSKTFIGRTLLKIEKFVKGK